MENRIREICRDKGVKMAELAHMVNMTQSNLVASLRKNPKLSTLQDICKALQIHMTDLFDDAGESVSPSGMAMINGKTYALVESKGVSLPLHSNLASFEEEIKDFVENLLDQDHLSARAGVIAGIVFYHVLYDDSSNRVFFTIHRSSKRVVNFVYRLDEMDSAQLVETLIADLQNFL